MRYFSTARTSAQRPLLERKEILKALLPRDPLLRYSEHVAEFGKREFAKARAIARGGCDRQACNGTLLLR